MALTGPLVDRALRWAGRHKRDIQDLSALAIALAAVHIVVSPMPAAAAICAAVVALMVPLRASGGQSSILRDFLAAVPRRCASVIATGLLLRYLLSASLAPLWFGVVWPLAAFTLDSRGLARAVAKLEAAGRKAAQRLLAAIPPGIELWSQRNPWIRNKHLWESVRIAGLVLCALFLLRGFNRATLNGTADAYWYGLNLADMVAQVRSGVFPVFVGQSLYQFNGAVCPIRVAPEFHYMGALLDLVTLHRLGTFALMNLMIEVVGVLGILSAYACLRALLPARKWVAAALAVLFLACPGTLGLAYNSDLYMSWMSVPLIPPVWYATIRSFEDRGRPGTLALLGAALGMCWWAHPPIALWSTLIAGAGQVARICVQIRGGFSWGANILAAAVFAALAAYPIGSVLFFPAGAGGHMSAFQRADSDVIAMFVREAYPAAILPMSYNGIFPGDYQMGYALWALMVFLVWRQRRAHRISALVPLASAFFIALLILPFPVINYRLWYLLPAFLRDTTGNWAMARLSMLLAAAIVFSAAAYWTQPRAENKGRRRMVTLALVFSVLCAWSVLEAGKFVHGSKISKRSNDSAADLLRPEAIQLTRYSYSMFPEFPTYPRYFSHGISDPDMENRLLSRDTLAPVRSNLEASVASGRLEATGEFKWRTGQEERFAVLDRKLHLESGRRYSLEFNFGNPQGTVGVLQLLGTHVFREYGLPDYGGSRAFGAGGDHENVLSVFSTAGPDDITVRFVRDASSPAVFPEPQLAKVALYSYDRDSLPVRVESWMPYAARVRSPAAAWLETPRTFQRGYSARVNGMPADVRSSPDALVCVAVPAGESRVELSYEAPAGLRMIFWLSFLSAIAAAGFGASRVILHLLGPPSPAKASSSTP